MRKLIVLFAAVALVFAFTVPAMAKTHIGGIIWTDFYIDDRDAEREGSTAAAPRNGTTKIQLANGAHSRFYGKWSNDDGVGLYIEAGIGAADGAGALWNTRHAYGWWQVNPGFKLLVGHTWSVFAPLTANAVMGFNAVNSGKSFTAHAIAAGYGNVQVTRTPQVRGVFSLGQLGNVQVALAQWDTNSSTLIAARVAGRGALGGWQEASAALPNVGFDTVTEQTVFPRLDVAATLKLGPLTLIPSFTYLNVEYDGVAAGSEDEVTVTGYSLGVKTGFGPIIFVGEITMGENFRDAGLNDAVVATSMASQNQISVAYLDAVGNTQVADTECLSWFANLMFKTGPATISLMYGVVKAENDVGPGGADDWEYESSFYGISVPIKVAKGFTIRPEATFYDEGDRKLGGATTELGSQSLYGVNFQVTF